MPGLSSTFIREVSMWWVAVNTEPHDWSGRREKTKSFARNGPCFILL